MAMSAPLVAEVFETPDEDANTAISTTSANSASPEVPISLSESSTFDGFSSIPAEVAFEVFAGRRYSRASYNIDQSFYNNSNSNNNNNKRNNGNIFDSSDLLSQYSIANGGGLDASKYMIETPLQRLRRLTAETKSLEEELLVAGLLDSQSISHSSVAMDLAALKDQLAAMNKNISSKDTMNVSSLSESFIGTVDAVKDAVADAIGKDQSFKYELVCPAGGLATNNNLTQLESSIHLLETVVGITNNTNINALPIYDRLQKLDKRLKCLENAENAIKDLETKSITYINRLNNISNGLSDEKRSQLYNIIETIEKWEHARAELPHIIERLRALKWIHDSALISSSTINSILKDQEVLNSQLAENKSLATSLKLSLDDNINIIKNNIKFMTDRMVNIENKMKK